MKDNYIKVYQNKIRNLSHTTEIFFGNATSYKFPIKDKWYKQLKNQIAIFMSLIISYITPNNAFVFSEGRLTTSDAVTDDGFDKTLSLFGGSIVCAFCGTLILNDLNGGSLYFQR